MMVRQGMARVFAMLLTALFVMGCGGPKLVDVTGTVTMEGSPVSDAGVTLQPEKGQPVTCVTDSAGKFTFEAAVGSYKVAIAKTEASGSAASETEEEGAESADLDEGPESGEIKFLTPEKYASPITSGLTLEVTAGMDPVTWDLTP